MHAELATALNQSDAPEYVGTDEIHGAIQGVLEIVGRVVREVGSRRQALLMAELSGPNHEDVRGDLERLHQTLTALEKDCTALIDNHRRVALGFTQYDRYATEIKTVRLAKEAREAPLPIAEESAVL